MQIMPRDFKNGRKEGITTKESYQGEKYSYYVR